MAKKYVLIAMGLLLVVLSACSSNSGGGKHNAAGNGAGQTNSSGAAGGEQAADPFGKYPETITLSYGKEVDPTDKSLPAGDSPENNQYSRYVKDNLNIDTKVSWQAATGTNYEQKVN